MGRLTCSAIHSDPSGSNFLKSVDCHFQDPVSFSRINFPDLRSPNSFDQINETCSHSWCLLAKGKGLKHSQKGILKKKLVESVRQLSAAIFRVILQSETIWECELLFTTNSLAVQTIHVGKRTRRCSMTHFIWSSLINEQMKQTRPHRQSTLRPMNGQLSSSPSAVSLRGTRRGGRWTR